MLKRWDDAVLRIGLLASAALCWYSGSRLWEAGNMIVERGALALALVAYFLAALLLFMAVIQPIPRWSRLLIPLTLVLMWGSLLFVSQINRAQSGGEFITDVHLFTDYAADLVRQGQNPYTYDMLDSYRVYRASQLYSTPLIDGDITGGVSYPSLGFLIYVPFQILHIDTILIYPIMLLLTLLLIWWIAPPPLRPLAVLPFLVNPNYVLYSLGGVSDIGWALLLCLMIVAWKRVGWRAVLFGLACAYKQQPWFLVPFLLVRLWYEAEGRPIRARLWELVKFGLIAALAFGIVNAPYIAANFSAWFNGILRPLLENMIILGQGYSSLSLFGIVFFPDWVFSLFSYGLLIVLLYLYARYYRRWPEALWMLPAIVLWFGHRSLSSYWYYYLFPLATALLIQYRGLVPILDPLTPDPSPTHAGRGEKSSRLWLTPIAIGAVSVIAALIFAAIPNPIQISLVGPVLYGGTDTRLTVQVANNGTQPLTPRFSVESYSEQPFFWDVLNGPSTVAAGQQATFTLHTDYPQEIFNISAGAQVIVSDATSYGLRAAMFLPSATTIYPDRVPNGDYVYWNPDDSVPYGWGFVGNSQTAEISLTPPDTSSGSPAHTLRLSVTPDGDQSAEVAVDTWLMLPEAPISLWVKPPAGSNQAPDFDTLYGLQIVLTANARAFYILFGDSAGSGTLPNGAPYTIIAAPSLQWSRVTFTLPEIIQSLNIPLPDPEIRSVGSLQIPMRMANFRLYLRSSQPTDADFGSITSGDGGVDLADKLIDQTISSPADILLWRGDINLQADNAEIARGYYQQAATADPKSGAAYYGLAASLVKLGRGDEALPDAQSALDNGYPYGARVYMTIGSADLGLKRAQDAQTAFASALDHLTSDGIVYDNAFQAQIYSLLGEALIQQNRPEVAEGMFDRANQLNPFDLANYQALIDIYDAQGRCEASTVLNDQATRYGLPLPTTTCK